MWKTFLPLDYKNIIKYGIIKWLNYSITVFLKTEEINDQQRSRKAFA